MPGRHQKLEETRPFRGIMGCDTLDFGLLASRPVGWYISVVLNHPSLWHFVSRTRVNKYDCLLPNYRTHHLQSQDLNACLSDPPKSIFTAFMLYCQWTKVVFSRSNQLDLFYREGAIDVWFWGWEWVCWMKKGGKRNPDRNTGHLWKT